MTTARTVIGRAPLVASQRGFSLVELLVAMLIALFVVGSALGTMLTQKRNLTSRDRFAAVQEQQRLTASILDDLIQSAGYFPDPRQQTATDAFPASAVFPTAGQSLTGTDSASGTADSISIRALASNLSTDAVMSCNGDSNAGGAAVSRVVVSTLSLDTTRSEILCTTDSAAATPIISGVQSLQIRYGVDADSNGSVDGYATATQVGAQWNLVRTVAITLRFANPYADQGQTAPLELRRTIQLMNQARPG